MSNVPFLPRDPPSGPAPTQAKELPASAFGARRARDSRRTASASTSCARDTHESAVHQVSRYTQSWPRAGVSGYHATRAHGKHGRCFFSLDGIWSGVRNLYMLFRQQPEEHLPHRVSRGILGRLGAPRLQLALQLARCHWQKREANVWGLQACADRWLPGSNGGSVAPGFEWRSLTVPRADGAALAPGLARRCAHLCLRARLRDVIHATALEGCDRRLCRASSARLLGLLRIPPLFLRTLCSGILGSGRQILGRGLLCEGGRLRGGGWLRGRLRGDGWLVGGRWLVLSGHRRAGTARR